MSMDEEDVAWAVNEAVDALNDADNAALDVLWTPGPERTPDQLERAASKARLAAFATLAAAEKLRRQEDAG